MHKSLVVCLNTHVRAAMEREGNTRHIAREVWAGDILAFEKGEEVTVLGVSPDPGSPEHRFVVYSSALGNTLLLREADFLAAEAGKRTEDLLPPVKVRERRRFTRDKIGHRKAIAASLCLLLVLLTGLGVYLFIFFQNRRKNTEVSEKCITVYEQIAQKYQTYSSREDAFIEACNSLLALHSDMNRTWTAYNSSYIQRYYNDVKDAAGELDSQISEFQTLLLEAKKDINASDCSDKRLQQKRDQFVVGLEAYEDAMADMRTATETILGSPYQMIYYMNLVADSIEEARSLCSEAEDYLDNSFNVFKDYLEEVDSAR
ncbi:MAG: hypothetical protein FJY85_03305 [Deltaproteobacteria bacterium]|nr:hypothetical protein [Deltaproteobacteria bacterium]